jgi:predicted protein tyrosine phosphatase
MKTRLLFICSGNMNRSPTAERLFKDSEKYEAKSAGTFPVAIVKVSQNLIDWADYIFTFCEKEDGHQTFLRENFDLKNKKVFDLDIKNIYDKNDLTLMSLIKEKISNFLPTIF